MVIGVRQKVAVLQLPCEVWMRSFDTVEKGPIPQLTLCRSVAPKDDHVTTLHTPCTTPFVTIARNSSVHAHNTKLRSITLKHFKTSVGHIR